MGESETSRLQIERRGLRHGQAFVEDRGPLASFRSRTLGDHLAVFPDVDWSPIHPRRAPGSLARTKQRALDACGKLRISVRARALRGAFRLHGPDSISFGGLLELSYTAQASARGRYRVSKFCQLLEKRRNASDFGTLCPPCCTLAAIRLNASRGDTSLR